MRENQILVAERTRIQKRFVKAGMQDKNADDFAAAILKEEEMKH